MTTLILAEKPSVGRDFAKALGARTRGEGFLAGDDLVVTWTVGHLLELLDPAGYDPRWKRWSLESLPILPDRFRYRPIAKTRKQLRIVRDLLRDRRPERIVIATDAGREGELIARTVLDYARANAPGRLHRFWTSQALTPEVIRKGMAALRPAAEFDRLWRAGQSRQFADWLVGMNGSRAATRRMGDLFSVGRVQTAALALIVDRRREREKFTPEPFWVLRVRFRNPKGEWWGSWFRGDRTRFSTEAEGQAVAGRVPVGSEGVVRSVRRENKKQPPPPLFSLTLLQREANRRYGFSAKATLNIAQRLYEGLKCLSYPRTDSTVLGAEGVELARTLVERLSGKYPEPFAGVAHELISADNRRVFDDAKLTDHHALIPMAPLPDRASGEDRKIYDLVLRRFAAAFHPDCEYERTEVVTAVGEDTFRTVGRRTLVPGWRAVYADEPAKPKGDGGEEEAEHLPPLEADDPARVRETDLKKKQTQPPPEYTEALLLKEMTNPARYVAEAELKRIFRGEVGLGTQATRAQIIETLLTRKYVRREKKHLIATDKGCRLIDTLRRFPNARVLASPEETARWEQRLDRIARGEGSETEFLNAIRNLVEGIVNDFKNGTPMPASAETSTPEGTADKAGKPNYTPLGTCPACGGTIIEGKRGFGCANWKEADGACRFVVWKSIAGRDLTPAEMTELLEKGEIGPLEGFTSRKGNAFSAKLKLESGEDGKWQANFAFENAPAGEPLGKCPACGGDVVPGPKGYGCANWREEDGNCKFVIWKTVAQKEITEEVAKQLLENGATDELFGFISRKGNAFSAKLRLETDESGRYKTVFEFADRPRFG